MNEEWRLMATPEKQTDLDLVLRCARAGDPVAKFALFIGQQGFCKKKGMDWLHKDAKRVNETYWSGDDE